MVTLPVCQENPYYMCTATSSPVLPGKCLQTVFHLVTYPLLDSALARVL